ncbi:winged helix-turn-helix domain-containing protein [Corynebacterium sp. LK2510]|uniref:winged helix-turn-helix domain-containing protein n=1 Tax=Corynebacterium sp. LK2510 TaxID=3110472 RepID=UPI0034CEDDF6
MRSSDTGHGHGFATDADDLAIMAEIRRTPLASFHDIAEATGIPERTVSRRFARLERLGAVSVTGRTLPGFDGTVAWMVRAASDVAHAISLSRYLSTQDRTRWVRVTTAHNEVVFGLISPGPDADPILAHLVDDPHVHSVQMYRLLQTWTAQGETTDHHSELPIDETDRAILAQLAGRGRTPHTHIAAALDLTPRTVTRRINRMVEGKVLFFEADTTTTGPNSRVEALIWAQVPPGKILDTAAMLAGRAEFPFVAASSGPYQLIISYSGPDNAHLLRTVDTALADTVASVDIVPLSPAVKRAT